MPIIKATAAPKFELNGAVFTGLASPTRGATETCVWRVTIAPGNPGAKHTVDREEVFAVFGGRARATIGEETFELAPGDALIVPPHVRFSLANPHDEPSRRCASCRSAAVPVCRLATRSCRRGRPDARAPRSARPAGLPWAQLTRQGNTAGASSRGDLFVTHSMHRVRSPGSEAAQVLGCSFLPSSDRAIRMTWMPQRPIFWHHAGFARSLDVVATM